MNAPSSAQSGNVFFYIFVAVALLAALSFVVAEGSRTTAQSLTSDKLNLASSEIIDYGSVIAKAATQLRLRGVLPEQISFAHPDHNAAYGTIDTNPPYEIFNSAGGGIVFRAPPADALTQASAGAPFRFAGNIEIDQVGSSCANAACSELLMFVDGLREDICGRINELVGVSNPSGVPPVDAGMDTSHFFAGTYAYASTVGDSAGSVNVAAHSAGCFRDNGTGRYVFYQVILPR